MFGENVPETTERLFQLEKELETQEQEIRDLATVASVITSILDTESVLAAAMEIGIRQVAGEVGAIVLTEGGRAEIKIAWGVDAEVLKALTYEDGLTIVEHVLRDKTTLCEELRSDNEGRGVSVRNFIASPIPGKAGADAVGAIIIFNKEGGGGFTKADVRRLETISKLTSVSIENSRLVKESLEKQKMEQELGLARQVQATFLPSDSKIDGLEIVSTYLPARHVGGDYYDLIPVSDRKLLFLIGDVTSKGVPAALVMAAVYSIIRSWMASGQPINLPVLMSHLNTILCRDVIKSHGMFITLFMAYLDLDAHVLEYCNGGHPPPFYRRSGSGEVIPLKQGGPLVGQFADRAYRSARLRVSAGDRLFCYTDGLTEASGRDGRLYGMTRLERFFTANCGMDAEQFSTAIKADLDGFAAGGGEDTVDDLTTLVIDIMTLPTQTHRYEFVYESRLESLERMYRDMDGLIVQHALPESAANPFRVAISEAMTNAIIHAHGGDSSKQIRITVELNDEGLTAAVADQGRGTPPDSVDRCDPVGSPEAEGGRGLGLIRRLMDEVWFESGPGGGTVVWMVKKLEHSQTNGGEHGHNEQRPG